jgi:hypothetical protein
VAVDRDAFDGLGAGELGKRGKQIDDVDQVLLYFGRRHDAWPIGD